MHENHFTCEADCRALENDLVVYSAFGSHLGAGVSQLVGRSLDAIVNLVFAGDSSRLVVADVDVKNFEFRIAAVHASSTAAGPVGALAGWEGVTAVWSIFWLSSI